MMFHIRINFLNMSNVSIIEVSLRTTLRLLPSCNLDITSSNFGNNFSACGDKAAYKVGASYIGLPLVQLGFI